MEDNPKYNEALKEKNPKTENEGTSVTKSEVTEIESEEENKPRPITVGELAKELLLYNKDMLVVVSEGKELQFLLSNKIIISNVGVEQKNQEDIKVTVFNIISTLNQK